MATITTTVIPFSSPDLNRPGAGAEQWHDRQDVNLGYSAKDVYHRFVATRIATGTRGVYSWGYFDGLVNQAIQKGQKMSFGMMTSYPEGNTSNGLVQIGNGYASYPTWLQGVMTGEWLAGSSWVPNYNDPNYLAWVLELNQAIYQHIQNTSFNGVRYRDVISSIDIRSYGSWGEWHSANVVDNINQYPSGTFPTAASLKKIVDAYVQGFPDIQVTCMIAAFDAHWLQNTYNPPEIAHYILTHAGNAKGPIGWRRDQWGATDAYLNDYLVNNNRTWNGSAPFKTWIMERWKTSPITGEPPAWIPDNYSQLESQIRLYHATSFGNGNYGTNTPNTTIQDRVKASSKAAGYRLQIENGSFSNTNNSIMVALNWRNAGIAPTYEDWTVQLLIKNSAGTVVSQGVSSFKPKRFLPATTPTTVTDTVSFSVPVGTYTLAVRLVDPTGYRKPMPLYINGGLADGSYNLAQFVVSGTPTNQPPLVNAGLDRTTTSSNVTISGTASDDGSIASVQWTRVSGAGTIITPNTLTTDISGLAVGANTFRLTVNDNQGLSASDEVTITLQPVVNTPPVVNAGPNQTITLPTSSVTLSGTATDAEGPVTVTWTRVAGSGVAVSPTSLTTQIVNLTQGTSTFRLVATDSAGAQAADNVDIIVNAAPVNKTVVSVTLNTATYKVTYSDGSTEIF